MDINAADLSARDQYKLLSGSIIPRPIAWMTTQTPDLQTVNLAPFSFFTGISNQLPLLSVAILRHDGPKDTAVNLLANEEAVVHIVSQDLVGPMNQSAATMTPDQSELTSLALPTVASDVVRVPGLVAPKIRLETQLYQYTPVTDAAGAIITDLFILKVAVFHFADAVIDPEHLYINSQALDPLARLSGPTYAHLGDTFILHRPR
ncbi:flavin reductase family protein [Lacticaseibacillus brantae]|uniref:Flavin reductase like domain-containing protein n=1 Tax=Lacticaseibacillus brantae DSM 23927 TaxID=1423727 RepID=A0A0R2AZH2_9LACO|nr:flavin reductase family protein [Lacticaseibacillus brantae]KRM71938.1 hypothetical protein FC34_GL000918 [Lacticaseibacillus brantae DSM 23927]